MNGNKKLIILSLVLLTAVFAVLSACKGTADGGGETVVVTDENGVPVTDENGETVTVVLQTESVEVTNENGEKVYDENGKVKTSVVYIPQEVGIPVTDGNGQAVTDENGVPLTTMITVSRPTGAPAADENGSTTEAVEKPNPPAVPGANSANWGASFGGTGSDAFLDTAAMSDGGFVALMQSNSTDGSMSALAGNSVTPIPVLIKYKKNGTVAWQKAIPSNYGVAVTGIAVDSGDNIAVSGYTKSDNLGFTNAGDYDAVLFKFNSRGDLQWLQGFGGTQTDGFNAVEACPDGGFAVIGYSNSPDGTGAPLGLSPTHSGAVIVKYAADGSLQFMKAIGSTGDLLNDVAVDKNGSIYAVGSFSSNDRYSLFKSFGRADAGILKLSANGDVEWVRQYGGSDIDNFPAVTAAPDGGCVIAGRSRSKDHSLTALSNHGGYDAVLVKFNGNGSLVWERALGGLGNDSLEDIVSAADGGYAAVGYSSSSDRDWNAIGNRGGTDGVIVSVTAAGDVTSVQGYGGSLNDSFHALCITRDRQIVACGETLSSDGDLVGASAESNGREPVGMIARFKIR